jgi:hypothetical protein
LQRYKCQSCRRLFQSQRKGQRRNQKLWKEYVWGKQNLKQLSEKSGHGSKWVRRRLDEKKVIKKEIIPQATVLIPDTTFFGKTYGVCVFRSPQLRQNLWWTEVSKEIMATYYYGRRILENKGWVFTAVVVDGRRGMTTVFKDIPVQICQFHQMRTVTKYLTRRPETPAGQDLRAIMLQLPRSNEKEFSTLLAGWKKDWINVINNKTYILGTKYWYYTYKKVRGAYMSLERNLPYLFTYQKYPKLNIPNTTNSLDGSFTHLKDKVNIHHGLRKDRRYKMIEEILGGEEK